MLAGDLNESHIGQRFIFKGMPQVTGTISVKGFSDTFSEAVIRISLEDADEPNPDIWRRGYNIRKDATVIPVDQTPADPVREKLAEYIRVEYLKRTAEPILSGRAIVMADIFMELMEGGTDANGEG